MALEVWPISDLYYPLAHRLSVDTVVNPFGGGYEQRIVTDIARGPRADGEGVTSIYVGRNHFTVTINNLRYNSLVHATNNRIDNSFKKLWAFYKSTFYDATTGAIRWEPFYIYNPIENDNISTWTGETLSNGVDSQGNAVTNLTGRYLVRFEQSSISMSRFIRCLFSGSIELIEVVA